MMSFIVRCPYMYILFIFSLSMKILTMEELCKCHSGGFPTPAFALKSIQGISTYSRAHFSSRGKTQQHGVFTSKLQALIVGQILIYSNLIICYPVKWSFTCPWVLPWLLVCVCVLLVVMANPPGPSTCCFHTFYSSWSFLLSGSLWDPGTGIKSPTLHLLPS